MKKIFDYIIITVANQFQKKILESKLMEIKKELSCDTEYIITIEKEKLGSGGALLKIINQVETNKKKILLINSAGKSTRMPIYADKGKIFIPTFSGNNKILLDEIIIDLTKNKVAISKDFLEKLRRTYAAIDNKMNMRCKYEEFLEYGENEK